MLKHFNLLLDKQSSGAEWQTGFWSRSQHNNPVYIPSPISQVQQAVSAEPVVTQNIPPIPQKSTAIRNQAPLIETSTSATLFQPPPPPHVSVEPVIGPNSSQIISSSKSNSQLPAADGDVKLKSTLSESRAAPILPAQSPVQEPLTLQKPELSQRPQQAVNTQDWPDDDEGSWKPTAILNAIIAPTSENKQESDSSEGESAAPIVNDKLPPRPAITARPVVRVVAAHAKKSDGDFASSSAINKPSTPSVRFAVPAKKPEVSDSRNSTPTSSFAISQTSAASGNKPQAISSTISGSSSSSSKIQAAREAYLLKRAGATRPRAILD